MTTIYYLSTIIFLFMEWSWLVMPIEKTKSVKRFNEMAKEHKGLKWDNFSTEYKSALKKNIWSLWLVVWIITGLFTSQWGLFLAFMVFEILVITPLSKLTKFSFAYTVLHWISSLISFAFALLLIINHFHLKLNLTQILLSYF